MVPEQNKGRERDEDQGEVVGKLLSRRELSM
jgi:hypothetical protein